MTEEEKLRIQQVKQLAMELADAVTRVDEASKLSPNTSKIWKDIAVRRARDIYRDRRLRNKLFPPGLFGEPAWDILLELFVAQDSGNAISVTSACHSGDVPQTTGLRWLALLEEVGCVEREKDPNDSRRSNVRLTSSAVARMTAFFARSSSFSELNSAGYADFGDGMSDADFVRQNLIRF